MTGAAGSFGGYVVQLAKADGLTVVADASEADDRAGALARRRRRAAAAGRAFAAAVRERFPDGVDGLADGSVQGAQVLPAVRDGGVVTTVRGYRGEDADAELARGVRVLPVMVRDYGRRTPTALDRLREQAEAGRGDPAGGRTCSPPAEAAEAHRRLEAGGVRGRLVLDFG